MSDLALLGLLDRFPAARVLCVGDLMLDRYIYGEAERVSAEAPVPVLRVGRQAAMPGGVGNVARNVSALGSRAVLVAVVGDDAAGRELGAMLQQDPGIEPRLIADASRPTTVKTRFVAGNQQLLRADEEATADIADGIAEALLAAAEAAMADSQIMILSDYAKGVLTADVLRRLIAAARTAGLQVVVDPKRRDVEAYAGATVIKPNARELAAITGMATASDADVEAAAKSFATRTGGASLLVSRSEKGMSLITASDAALHLPTRAPEVFDVSGAGDTVVAVAAVALAAGGSLPDAALLANVAGGLVVAKVGTAVTGTQELTAALLQREVSDAEAKVMSVEAAHDAVARWRARGLRVGFTNGCFDLLHPGHVSLLSEARSFCDRLVVGLNSDDSVKRLKGPERPVQSESARALMLASMTVVDGVVIFDEDTPIPLLQRLQPDVLVKGGDYSIDQVVGADVVRGYGGTVRLAQLVPGHSSTNVIARMTGRKSGTA